MTQIEYIARRLIEGLRDALEPIVLVLDWIGRLGRRC
jgi:hypothetical protein